ncbi:MAG: hypothetical protein ABSC94_17855 [Polyangiaceae bacterium]|jgi:hypothetical protein
MSPSSLRQRGFPRGPSPSTAGDGEQQAARALEVVLRTLEMRPQTDAIAALLSLARGLMAQIEGWRTAPPSAELRDQVMRRVLSIHLGALRETRGQNAAT